jgi:hypothetical protein
VSSLNQFLKLFLQADLLCNELGIEPKANVVNQVPSEEEIDDYEVYVKEISDEKVRNFWLSFIILFMIIIYKIVGIMGK